MIMVVTQTPESQTEPTLLAAHPRAVKRPGRLIQALAWVGIVAGIVFIVAVVFFSGFVIGKHSGTSGWGHHRHHHEYGMSQHGGHPPMGHWQFPGGAGWPPAADHDAQPRAAPVVPSPPAAGGAVVPADQARLGDPRGQPSPNATSRCRSPNQAPLLTQKGPLTSIFLRATTDHLHGHL
jgi:hypothetical protein